MRNNGTVATGRFDLAQHWSLDLQNPYLSGSYYATTYHSDLSSMDGSFNVELGLTVPLTASVPASSSLRLLAPTDTTGPGMPAPSGDASSGLTINILSDGFSTVPAAATTALETAVQFFQRNFVDPVTINIAVGWGEVDGQFQSDLTSGSTTGGEEYAPTSAYYVPVSYSTFENKIAVDARSADDLTAFNALANHSDPTFGGTIQVPLAEAKALGISIPPGSPTIDAFIGFNNSLNWNYNQNPTSDTVDLIGIAEHEISHAMARVSGLGNLFATDVGGYTPLDLFRFSDPSQPDPTGINATAQSPDYFSFNYGTKLSTNPIPLMNFQSASNDPGDWTTAGDSFGTWSYGTPLPVSDVDLRELDVLGFDRNFPPNTPTASNQTESPGGPVALDTLFTNLTDPDGGDSVQQFYVRDRTVGGGYLTFKGAPQPQDQVLGPYAIGQLADWKFVASATVGQVDNIGFQTVDSHGLVSDSAVATVTSAICFCRGTQILTPSGEKPIETLSERDIVLTNDRHPMPIMWIGHGRVSATRGHRTAATPVIVCKGALSDNVPNRDLRVTKGHALFLEGVLVPVEFLVNHRSIIWDDRAQEVEIYHLELARHAVLIANGASAESYRDDGNRWLFDNANSDWRLPPKEPCAPLLTGGSLVDAIWRQLLDRAGSRPGLPLTKDPGLHLVADGRRVERASCSGSSVSFLINDRPRCLGIASRSGSPAELGLARDPRVLGIAVKQIVVRQDSRFRVVHASDERTMDGFYDYEPLEGIRWTNGYGLIPEELFVDFEGAIEVVLDVGGTMLYPIFDAPSHAFA